MPPCAEGGMATVRRKTRVPPGVAPPGVTLPDVTPPDVAPPGVMLEDVNPNYRIANESHLQN